MSASYEMFYSFGCLYLHAQHSTISVHMCRKGSEGATVRWSTVEAKLSAVEKGNGAVLPTMRQNTLEALLVDHQPSPLSAPWVGGQGLASPVANV